MALDQATMNFLEAAAAAAGPDATPMWELSPEEARVAAAANDEAFGPGPEMYQTDNHVLKSYDGGEIEVRVHRPTENPHSVVVYLHGGGWVVSNIDSFDTLGRMLAEKSDATVVLVNYRKAPEYPFPAPVEDSWVGLTWAAENIAELAAPGAKLYVGGDSAGGNLSAVMALRAKENGGPHIDRQFLIYPVTDADFERGSYNAPENQTLLPRPFMEWFWDHYCPDVDQRLHPEVSPLHATDHSGVAPALVITAAHDVLHDEGEAYAKKLEEAGVDVEYRRWPGQMHGFFGMINILPASNELLDLIAQSIQNAATTEKAGA